MAYNILWDSFQENNKQFSFIALSVRELIAVSMVAPSPSSTFMPCASDPFDSQTSNKRSLVVG